MLFLSKSERKRVETLVGYPVFSTLLLDSDTASRMRMIMGTPKPSPDALNHKHLVKGGTCIHIDRDMTTICGKYVLGGTPHGWLCKDHNLDQAKAISLRIKETHNAIG